MKLPFWGDLAVELGPGHGNIRCLVRNAQGSLSSGWNLKSSSWIINRGNSEPTTSFSKWAVSCFQKLHVNVLFATLKEGEKGKVKKT